MTKGVNIIVIIVWTPITLGLPIKSGDTGVWYYFACDLSSRKGEKTKKKLEMISKSDTTTG